MHTRYPRPIHVCVAALLCTLACQLYAQSAQTALHFAPLARKPVIELTPSTVDAFASWTAIMPSSQVPEVQQQIALAKSDPKIVDAVAAKLSFQHPGSYGRQLILLSILGELRSDRALPALQEYLNSSACPVNEQHAAASTASAALLSTALPVAALSTTTTFDACAGLKAAAINMIAYIHTAAAQAIVLQAVQQHPSRCVRLSAINAYLYNEGDTPQALAAVQKHARPAEAKFSGIPRLTRTTDPKQFATRFNQFYAEHKEEVPANIVQVTARTSGNHAPPKLSVTPTAGTTQKESR